MEWKYFSEQMPVENTRIAVLAAQWLDVQEEYHYWIVMGYWNIKYGLNIPELNGFPEEKTYLPIAWCIIPIPDQPKRSKRKDSWTYIREMRCSEHCGNTVREAQ